MYDFVVYIFFAPFLAKQFFPTESHFASLLLVFSVFAVGFFCRVLGALIFGYLGDTKGRKKTLIYTVTLMAFPMVILTLLPTYQQIGIAAPIILTVMRCLQGLAVGGEFSGSLTLVTEYFPTERRGYVCSWIILALNAGILLASLVSMLINKLMIENHGLQWGWRVAFFLGCILAIIIAVMRRHFAETPLFLKLSQQGGATTSPVLELFLEQGKSTLQLIFANIGPALSVGMIMFLPTYLQSFSHINHPTIVFISNSIFLFILCVLLPIFGRLSDKIGRKPVLGVGLVSIAVLIHPIGHVLSSTQNYFIMLLCLFCLAVMVAMVLGAFGGFLADNFATKFRASGIGLSYNIPFALITGTFPMLSLAIIHHTHTLIYQYGYVSLLALISLIFVMSVKR